MKLGSLLGLLIPLTLSAGLAHATDSVGYVDMTKAIGATQEGKKAKDDFDADVRVKQAAVYAAETSAKQAAERCAKISGTARAACDARAADARAEADRVGQQSEQALQLRKNDYQTRINQRLIRIVPAIGVAHHLERVENSAGAIWISPKADFTTELVGRYDKGEGKSEDQVAAELRQKNADLERDKADSAKRIAELEAKVAAAAARPDTVASKSPQLMKSAPQ